MMRLVRGYRRRTNFASFNTCHTIGMESSQTKRYEEMIPLYHELLRQRPDRFHYLQQYGALLLSLNRFEEGRRVIEKAISLRPKEFLGYVTLATQEREVSSLMRLIC